jgi:hypothetical protein
LKVISHPESFRSIICTSEESRYSIHSHFLRIVSSMLELVDALDWNSEVVPPNSINTWTRATCQLPFNWTCSSGRSTIHDVSIAYSLQSS